MANVTITEGDLLRAALARAGRQAFLGGEGGMSYLILAVAPAGQDGEQRAYGGPHLLMYAGEQADRPAAEHRDPWSAHLHGANGDYVATVFDDSPAPLDAAADAELCATKVLAWLGEHLGDVAPRPDHA
ncbi:hypothetical protein [Streptomyces sp. NPDC005148]